nr:GntR family transcriptional regulator [Sphingomonas sp. CDS-1]
MHLQAGILGPIGHVDGRRIAIEVYEVLQDAILSGRIKPGTVLSQVEVANELNVSRTPVREVMRKLQQAGLISDEPNLRSRVLAFDPQDMRSGS